jgi:hypothetical protein
MNKIPIFDSLTHPMPNGNWLHDSYCGKNALPVIVQELAQSNIKWALAVGMGPNIGNYCESDYVQFITAENTNIFPVAYIDFPLVRDLDKAAIKNYLLGLSQLGYVGIKLHPRMGQFSFCEPQIATIIKMAADIELAVLLCTYCWEDSSNNAFNTPFSMMQLLSNISGAPVILVHGGGVLLMQYIEIARAFPNVLLDLSLTICKYKGSSLDMDIKFAFSQFDRRICIGSDGPEFSSVMLRKRFNYFSKGIPENKLKNIAYRNLFSFIPKLKNRLKVNDV